MKARLPSSARLQMIAMLASSRILIRGGTLKQYQDNQKALLNNPQWRAHLAKSKEEPKP
jgi:hypothetical protein